jgi:hypothetical protein
MLTPAEAIAALPPVPAHIRTAFDRWQDEGGADDTSGAVAEWVDSVLPEGYAPPQDTDAHDEFWTDFWCDFETLIDTPQVCPYCGREYTDLTPAERADLPFHCPSDDCPGRDI